MRALSSLLGAIAVTAASTFGSGGARAQIVTTAVAGGDVHTCALASDGVVRCWGYNGNGQLGDNTVVNRLAPVYVYAGFTAVAAGGAHTCALTSAGAVWCWGMNNWGQLGNATRGEVHGPGVPVVGLSGVAAITAGMAHTCALTTGGGVKCWGENNWGQMGDGSVYTGDNSTDRLVPVDVVGLASGVAAIAAGRDHTCALTTTGGVKCWGFAYYGQLGDGGTGFENTLQSRSPVDVVGLASGVTAIGAGVGYSCAVLAGGGVKCWGSQHDAIAGTASPDAPLVPVDVPGLASIAAISLGAYHACALTTAGAVQCWGFDYWGQLGDGTDGDINHERVSPVPVSGLSSGIAKIDMGSSHSCAITTRGGVKCWGQNHVGQLGDNSSVGRNEPVNVYGLTGGAAPNVAFPDFNADGKPDLVWTNTASGANYLWYMNGPAFISDAFVAAMPPGWRLEGVADFNADGHPDLVWRNANTGETQLWYMNGSSLVSSAFLFSIPPEWVIQGVADFNADGKPDFLLRNSVSGNAFAWFFNDNVAIGDQFLFGIDPSWKVEQVGDLNGDGQPDLLFRNMASGLAFTWFTQFSGGTLSLAGASAPMFAIDPAWEIVQLADWNGDGNPDLLFRNRDTGLVFAWYLNGTTLGGSDFVTQIDPGWEIVPHR